MISNQLWATNPFSMGKHLYIEKILMHQQVFHPKKTDRKMN